MATGDAVSNRDAGAGPGRMLVRSLAAAIALIALAWAVDLYQLVGLVLYPAQIVTVVLGLAIALAFIRLPGHRHTARDGTPWHDRLAAACGLITALWMSARYPLLVDLTIDAPTEAIVIGLTLISLTLEALRRATGPALPLIVVAFIAYAAVGHFIPGPFAAQPTSWDVLAAFLAFDANALPGGPLLIVCNVVISFVFFGSLLRVTGGADVFASLAETLMGRYRGGPAKVAVLGSALFGSISGSAVANVVATGVVTIPMIRKSGYSAERAAAIEAVSSTGGQLLPPVMGAAAFLMADFLQISYAQVVLAALIPGILYYVSLFIQVDLLAARDGHAGIEDRGVSGSAVWVSGWLFLLPFAALIVALFRFDFDPQMAAILASAVLIAGTAIRPYQGLRPNPARIREAVCDTGLIVVDLVLICAGAGIVIGVLANSGLGFTFTNSLFLLGTGNAIALLVLAAVVCVVLGMGLPTLGVYVLLATLVAPGLVEVGIAPIAAHLFVMYYGMMSMITPPVAVAAFTAAGVAGADPMRSALISVKTGWLAYVVPFAFVFSPGLTMQGSAVAIAMTALTLIAGIFLVSVAITGFFLRRLGTTQRLLAGVTGSLLCVPIQAFSAAPVLVAAGGISAVLFIGSEILLKKRTSATLGESDSA